ncbi:Emopamil-binding protein-like [Lamellibrachia satsuma]|nr:Emopamil-binding protein-like [Lamellibrachia satsuma]
MEPMFTLALFGSVCFTVVAAVISVGLARWLGKQCSVGDKLTMSWLLWDCTVHFSLEAVFLAGSLSGNVQNSTHWAMSTWREYGKADKRFLVSDPTIVSMAIPTVLVCGPLCLGLIYSIVRQRSYRHWLQVALCVCELYGAWMTFCPELLTGCPNLATDVPLYFWFYIVFFNGLWVAAPVLMLGQSWMRCSVSHPAHHDNGGGDNGFTSIIERRPHTKVD